MKHGGRVTVGNRITIPLDIVESLDIVKGDFYTAEITSNNQILITLIKPTYPMEKQKP